MHIFDDTPFYDFRVSLCYSIQERRSVRAGSVTVVVLTQRGNGMNMTWCLPRTATSANASMERFGAAVNVVCFVLSNFSNSIFLINL